MPSESNTTAQNKMGELYVDFGTKGLGGLLSGLNGVKAQFLLTKTAAEQAIKPLVSFSKGAASSVTELNKINAVTGLTIGQLQDLKVWSELNNVSFGELTNQLKTMQQNLLDIRFGRGDVSGYQLLGIDPSQLDYRKPLEAFAKIRERVQQVDEATGALALRQLGFSEDLLYAFKQNNNLIDKKLFLNNKEIQSLNEQQKAWNQLSVTWSQAQQKFIANQPWIISLIDKTTQAISSLNEILSSSPEEKTKAINSLIGGGFKNLGHFVSRTLAPDSKLQDATIFQSLGMNIGKALADYAKYTFKPTSTAPQSTQKQIKPFETTQETLPALPPADIRNWQPSNSQINYNGNTNNSIQVNNYISGNNPQDIANQTSNAITNDLNNLEILNDR